jgi:Fe2+ or Zn2+ uptake regulation protein
MPQARSQLETLQSQSVNVVPGTHKASVLALLARNPEDGYAPQEIAAESPVPQSSVYKVLQRLREDELVEKISDHYLVNTTRLEEINEMLLTTDQFAAAQDISDTNTAPSEVEAVDPGDLNAPEDDLSLE